MKILLLFYIAFNSDYVIIKTLYYIEARINALLLHINHILSTKLENTKCILQVYFNPKQECDSVK